MARSVKFMKKIIITADLHYPITKKEILRQHFAEIASHKPDAVIVAGDIGETRITTQWVTECLKMLRDVVDCPVGAFAGNHDLWSNQHKHASVRPRGTYTSAELWASLLQKSVEDAGCEYIENKVFMVGDIAIVGSYLHYDYSAIDTVGPCSQFTPEYFEENKYKVNNDGVYFIGVPDDRTFAKQIGVGFCKRLKESQKDKSVKSIIVATHVPCVEEQMTRNPHNFQWAFGTPFFGNLSYVKQMLKCDKLTHIVCGHSHVDHYKIIERGNMKNVRAVNIGGDYGAPAYLLIEETT